MSPRKLKSKKNQKLPPDLLRFAEAVGQFIAYWGFKSIHGKIWTLLYLSESPLSATSLCKLLGVSKTLLSFSVRELLDFHVIEADGKGPRRTIYYRANPDTTAVIMNVLKRREKPMLAEIEAAHAVLKRSHKNERSDFAIQNSKLKDIHEMISSASFALDAILLSSDFNLNERLDLAAEALSNE